jgi:hypothetical protein
VGCNRGIARAGAAGRRKRPSKQEKVIEMLRRPEGATVDEVVRAAGWQRHTARGVFLVTSIRSNP